MKTAFLRRNFKRLDVELRGIFFAHLVTLVGCFFPWISTYPLSKNWKHFTPFEGEIWLIGIFIFFISLAIVVYFVDVLLQTEKIKFPFKKETAFFSAGVAQVIFIILAWSVLMVVKRNFEDAEIRFGMGLCLIAQMIGVVFAYLYTQKNKMKQTEEFFQMPGNTPHAEPKPIEKK